MFNRLARVPQPWLFFALAVGFGVIAYFASRQDLVRGVIGGLLFGALVSVWLVVRERLWRS
jgi:lipid-A-disaccharide synthase-like uncharacterized protein